MPEKKDKTPDLARARAIAGNILAANENRLLLIEAILVLLSCILPYILLDTLYRSAILLLKSWGMSSLAPLAIAGYLSVLFLLTVLLILPLLLGLLQLSCDLVTGTPTSLLRLFSSFENRSNYRRACAIAFGFGWRLALLTVIVYATCSITLHFFSGSLAAGLLCGLCVLLELLITFWITVRRFGSTALAICEETALRTARKNAVARASGGAVGTRFFWYFLPQILLGLLTFGIFLIWEVLPRMCISYFLYCLPLNETTNQSEEYKK